ncbi:MAG: META domain-containing protein [Candidatus Electrothrix sp. AUS1_2]|nr:META domain-containing protein [Candidatus Electrothrix sp. AUS1_2]
MNSPFCTTFSGGPFMPNLALKKTKKIITTCCLAVLPFAFTTNSYAVGARGELTCYNSCTRYSIETPADHYTEDQATENLYRDALFFCSDKGGLTGYRVDSFFSAENIQLTGTSWEVTEYNDGQGLVEINLYKKLPIRFGEDGRFGGGSFCNNYMGEYTVSGNQISMKGGIITYKSCEESRMRQDELLLEAFRAATRYEIRGDQLMLEDDNGTLVVVLTRK